MSELPVREIFSSIQGEGPYVGVRQIFLRLPGCNLACPYCDTPVDNSPRLSLETVPGSRNFQYLENPLGINKLLGLVMAFNLRKHHSLSVTGGEPLLWHKELAEFLPLVKKQGLKIYLETNGTLPERLDLLLPWLDFISMDIKLPFGGRSFWQEHCQFLKLSCNAKEVFIKIVLDSSSSFSDLKTARQLIADIDSNIPTILQPVTAVRGILPPKPRQMLEWQDYFLESLNNVRIIPQTHVLQGQL
ncbi:MAG TPA: 7-carboxy-7-deazaguanine synthase QueE [Desulfitobacteriaceae bacterium]|nr:7-carboxy-7-deazaguanine synthase QueE [Desulfitobacteriaceae bacterium]